MSLSDYHKSITNEIISTSNRVRDLVTHWGEEGRYKEEVFKNILKRFLPNNLSVGTGFILNSKELGEHDSSKQIDVIIYDNSFPVLFREADFVIIPAEGVRGIVEIKANLLGQSLSDVVNISNENGKFIYNSKHNKDTSLFNGIFSFNGRRLTARNHEDIRNSYNSLPIETADKYCVNHLAISKDTFVKHWDSTYGVEEYSEYNLVDLTFSFFISNLLNFVSNQKIERDNFIWFTENKEDRIVANF